MNDRIESTSPVFVETWQKERCILYGHPPQIGVFSYKTALQAEAVIGSPRGSQQIRQIIHDAVREDSALKAPFPILVAEDDFFYGELLNDILTRAGYEVVCVQNGREALKALENRFFPVVLTDWIMPEMDGIELCSEIRKRPTSKYVFVILLTVMDSKQDIINKVTLAF